MDVYYQSMPELNILVKQNDEINSNELNNQSPTQFSNKSEDLKEAELQIINDLEETCRANEGILDENFKLRIFIPLFKINSYFIT